MTDQTKPTDAEIESLYANETGFLLQDSQAAILDFTRAALARWGAPQASEPVAWLWQHSETGRTRIVMPDQIVTAEAAWIAVGPLHLGAAPQAQPLVALSDEQILDIAHRICTKYAHFEHVKYGFSEAELLQFAHRIHTKGESNADT